MPSPVVYCYPVLTASFDISPDVRFIRSSVRPGPEIIEILAASMMTKKNFGPVGSIYVFISIVVIRNSSRGYVPHRPPSRPNWTMRLITAFGCYPHIWAFSRQYIFPTSEHSHSWLVSRPYKLAAAFPCVAPRRFRSVNSIGPWILACFWHDRWFDRTWACGITICTMREKKTRSGIAFIGACVFSVHFSAWSRLVWSNKLLRLPAQHQHQSQHMLFSAWSDSSNRSQSVDEAHSKAHNVLGSCLSSFAKVPDAGTREKVFYHARSCKPISLRASTSTPLEAILTSPYPHFFATAPKWSISSLSLRTMRSTNGLWANHLQQIS